MTHEAAIKTSRINSLAAYSIIYVLVLAKGFDRLIHAGIWAEDGKVFLKQSFEIGWTSLFIPYDGYFHTVPRLITLAATWLPVALIPAFIVLICYAVFAYSASLVLYHSHSWLFEKRAFAILCSILLLLSPGQIITLGNTANIHWYLLLILALYGLKNIETPFTITELIVAFLCVASEGAAIILIPLFAARIILKYNKGLSANYGELLICAFLLLFAAIHLSIATSSPSYGDFSAYFTLLLDHFFHFFILHIVTGDALLTIMSQHAVLIQLVAVAVSVGLAFVLKRIWKRELVLLLVFCGCSLLLPVMIAMARPQNLEILRNYFDYNIYEWFRFRYSFFVPAAAAVFWCCILSRISTPKWSSLLIIGLILLVNVSVNSYRIPIRGYKEFKDWQSKADILHESMRGGCPQTVHIHINPGKWSVVFKSPIQKDCNEEQ